MRVVQAVLRRGIRPRYVRALLGATESSGLCADGLPFRRETKLSQSRTPNRSHLRESTATVAAVTLRCDWSSICLGRNHRGPEWHHGGLREMQAVFYAIAGTRSIVVVAAGNDFQQWRVPSCGVTPRIRSGAARVENWLHR